jgi:hypothetical protein
MWCRWRISTPSSHEYVAQLVATEISHLDHIIPYRDGGPTTFDNGRGVCERHNQVREMPGWTVQTVHTGCSGHPDLIASTAPTGHAYLSRAPNPP